MTRKTFYKNLEKCKNLFIWKIESYGMIRGYLKGDKYPYNSFCPITAVCYSINQKRYLSYSVAAKKIGLPEKDAVKLACAADGNSSYVNQEKAIIKHLGLD